MSVAKLSVLALASLAAAAPSLPSWGPSHVAPLEPAFHEIFPQGAPLTPQILATFEQPNLVNIARNSYVYRQGSSLRLLGDHFTASGANVYWLGLDENVIPPAGQPFYAPFNASYPTLGRITEIMNTLVTLGAKVVRSQTLGVSVGNPLSVMPALGVYNEQAFNTIDWAVYQARQHGIRIVAPLIDNYDYYHGGKYDFLRFRGYNVTQSENSPLVMEFYNNPVIVQDFKNYIQHLITHVNQYTGLSYAEDPTILGYETGNELSGPNFGDMDVPVNWTQDIASFVKSLGPNKLVIDGTYGVNKTHLDIPEIDIYSDHFYPLNTTKLEEDIALVATANKVYWAGEYDWTGLNGQTTPQGSTLSSFYAVIEAQQNKSEPVIAGDAFWSLFMHDVPNCNIYVNHSDGFTMHYGDPNNSAYINGQISLVREHLFAMQNISVNSYLPAVACPGNFIPGYDAQYTYY